MQVHGRFDAHLRFFKEYLKVKILNVHCHVKCFLPSWSEMTCSLTKFNVHSWERGFLSTIPQIYAWHRTLSSRHWSQESELSICAERKDWRSAGQGGFWTGFTNLDHLLTFWAVIEESNAHNKRIYCCFVNFWKAFELCCVFILCIS